MTLHCFTPFGLGESHESWNHVWKRSQGWSWESAEETLPQLELLEIGGDAPEAGSCWRGSRRLAIHWFVAPSVFVDRGSASVVDPESWTSGE